MYFYFIDAESIFVQVLLDFSCARTQSVYSEDSMDTAGDAERYY